MSLLGQRTAEMHEALLTDTDDPAFAPEPISSDDVSDWVASVHGEAVETFDLLARRRQDLAEADWQLADRLLAARHEIESRLESLRLDAGGLRKSRYHGDYHLGQVLLAEEDFVIIDFEGEPARSIEERRRKHSVLKDVAGMLRSFDYAAFMAARESLEPTGLSQETLIRVAKELRDSVMDAFLDGYAEHRPEVTDTAARQLLELFVWEKALYELRYEIRTRPTWVGVPLYGLASAFFGE
jgi:maltose alpha-D-glucosyltransferase/alpha-amylase